jgi:hypothetical protein
VHISTNMQPGNMLAQRSEAINDSISASSHTRPVTGDELYCALFQEDQATLQQWLARGQITDVAMRSVEPHTGESLLVYLTQNPKRLIAKEIVALINLVPADLVSVESKEGLSPLLLLAKQPQSVDLMEALLTRGANANARDSKGRTVLMHCIINAFDHEMIRSLCRQGVWLEAKDQDGNTALHHAVALFNCSLIPVLIAAGANKSVKNNADETPDDIALRLDSPEGFLCRALQQSQVEHLSYYDKIFGEGIGGDLLKASTLSWERISSSVAYAMSLFGSAKAPPLVEASHSDSVNTSQASSDNVTPN